MILCSVSDWCKRVCTWPAAYKDPVIRRRQSRRWTTQENTTEAEMGPKIFEHRMSRHKELNRRIDSVQGSRFITFLAVLTYRLE